MEALILNEEEIKNKIFNIRGVQVMFDSDLAKLYDVETKVLNQAVKRNIERFPEDFMFQLTKDEFENCKSQNAISNINECFLWSQSVTLKNDSLRLQNEVIKGGRGEHKKYRPHVFTEQGVAMLSGILKSKKAIEVNIQIMRAFTKMRKYMQSNNIVLQRLDTIEKRQSFFEIDTGKRFEKIFDALENNQIKKKEGVFYEGEIFDAYSFVSGLIKQANKKIILVDNYVDESVLTLLTKRKDKVKVTLYTEKISKELDLDLKKFNSQYKPIEVKVIKNCHDRFIIIDKTIYHFGASLKDLGRKLFAFSRFEKEGFKLVDKLNGKV